VDFFLQIPDKPRCIYNEIPLCMTLLRQLDIWFIGTGGLSDCVKIQSIKHMWANTNLMEPPALRHGPPDGGWDSMVAKLQSHILLGPTAQRWVF
jgi:hypothetical protein